MAHGKETPRQKMIGMMYLVLTALLALNVSTSVLDAFKIIDEGLSKTNNTLKSKNAELYSSFQQQAELNAKKAGKWRDDAFSVKVWADSLDHKIQKLKLQVVKEAEGSNKKAIVDGQINRDEIKAVTDYDTPNRIMIGNEVNSNSEARKLKNEIEQYRAFLLSSCRVGSGW